MLRPVEPKTLPDDVFGQLLAEILSGRYAPGAALPSERALTQTLKVNRHVVREALKRLEQIGLVKTAQGGRTRVLDFRRTAGLDLLAVIAEHAQAFEGMLEAAMQMRAVIGLDVARLAAQNASLAIRRELPLLADELASIGRGPELLPLDQRFWRLMLDGAGQPRLPACLQQPDPVCQRHARAEPSLAGARARALGLPPPDRGGDRRP